jgi:phosphoribosylformimino-5-aminoimidazole carboxamide ribotide isomerase
MTPSFRQGIPQAANRRSLFRPCIDLHNGQVKQIVGGSLSDEGPGPQENFVSQHDAAWYAKRYRDDACTGGHIIKLGPGNDAAAKEALAAWPTGMQLGGGITLTNAAAWLEAGASQVIVTSWLFTDGAVNWKRVAQLSKAIGPERLVIDLSCRRVNHIDNGEDASGPWRVATDRWQTVTQTAITAENLARFADYCSEFLIHAADVEGLQGGIDHELVRFLGQHSPLPTTYAGGARSLADLEQVHQLSDGRVDLTIGSALDIFGGSGATYADCVAWNAGPSTPPDANTSA